MLTYGCETRREIEYKQKDLWCGHRRILLVPGGDWRADYGAGAGLAALWGAHTFLSMAKEKCAKESQRHGTPEAAHVAMRRGLRSAGALWAVLDLGSLRLPAGKKPFIAHFDGGARNVARNFVGELPPTFARAPVLPFFRRQNGRAFFPSLPNAALLPRSWHRADSNSGAWELQRSLSASQRRETDLIFSFTAGARHA